MSEETVKNKKATRTRKKNKNLAFLDALLRGNGLTYLELATLLGASQTSMADWVKKDDIKTTQLSLISERLGYQLQYGFIPKGEESFQDIKEYELGDNIPSTSNDKALVPIIRVMRAKNVDMNRLAELLHTNRNKLYYRFRNGMLLSDLMEIAKALGGTLEIELKKKGRLPLARIEI